MSARAAARGESVTAPTIDLVLGGGSITLFHIRGIRIAVEADAAISVAENGLG